MGFVRVAMVTAAPVFAKRCSTMPVDGAVARALRGYRIFANPPPPEPAPKEPDPILKFRQAGKGFPGRDEREEMFQRLVAICIQNEIFLCSKRWILYSKR